MRLIVTGMLSVSMLAGCATLPTEAAPPPPMEVAKPAQPALWLWLNYDGLSWKEAGVTTTLPYGMALKNLPGDSYTLDYSSDSETDRPVGTGCETVSLKRFPGVSLMFEDGVLTRIDAYRPAMMMDNNAPPPAEYGVGFGAIDVLGKTQREFESLYQPADSVTPHPYLGDLGRYLIYEARGRGLAMILETEGEMISSLRVGKSDSVHYIEGCL